jgi:hypothetical protein
MRYGSNSRLALLLCVIAQLWTARGHAQNTGLPVGHQVELCGSGIVAYGTEMTSEQCALHASVEKDYPWLMPRLVRGYVSAMGTPPGEQAPQWEELREGAPPVKVSPAGDYLAMSGDGYNDLIKAFTDFVASRPAGSWRAVDAVSYPATPCAGARGVPEAAPDSLAGLPVRYVVVRETPAAIERCDGLLLFASPLNIAGGTPPATTGYKSLLLNRSNGEIEKGTAGRFARKVGYFEPPAPGATPWCKDPKNNDPDVIFASCPSREIKNGVWRPIAGIQVGNDTGQRFDMRSGRLMDGPLNGSVGLTDATGYYSIIYPFASQTNRVNAKISLAFPGASRPPIRTVFPGQAGVFPIDPSEAMILMQSQQPSTAEHKIDPERYRAYANIGVNVALVSANLTLSNEGLGDGAPSVVTVASPTEFDVPALTPDCEEDEAEADPACQNDPSRRFRHRGLVRQISPLDLRNTDFYVYRQSDGALGIAQYGLPATAVPEGAQKAKVEVVVPLGGLKAFRSNVVHGSMLLDIADGDPYANLTVKDIRKYFEHQPDYDKLEEGELKEGLRFGEPVMVVALNRATGYIATCYTDVAAADTGGAAVISCPEMSMRPPNLSVTATRKSKLEVGARANSPLSGRTTMIGFEGAANTSDTFVQVRTAWYDQDGRPLPPGLPGFQGRLARVCSPSQPQLCGSPNMGYFSVKPGVNTELIQVPNEGGLERAFYYVHIDAADPATIDAKWNQPFPQNEVCYKPENDEEMICVPEASTSSPLNQRAADYVPFKVAFFDQDKTKHARDEKAGGSPDAEPVYKYFYRPEMSFSILEMELSKLVKTDAEGEPQEVEISEGESPKPIFLSTDDLSLELVYSLLQDDKGPLAPIDLPRHMVLLAGDKEISVEFGADRTVTLDEEDLKALDADDLSALRLVQRYDEENILWQFAFAKLLVMPSGTDPIEVSADEAQVRVNALVLDGDTVQQGEPLEITWDVEGSGQIVGPRTETSQTKTYSTQVELSTTAGAISRVSVTAANGASGPTAYSSTFKTVPGNPSYLGCVELSGKTVIGGLGGVEVHCTLLDRNSNHIPNYPLTVDAVGLNVESTRLTNQSGTAVFRFVGNNVAGSIPVAIHAADQSWDGSVPVHDVALSWAAPSRVLAGEVVPVTISATSAYGDLSGLPVGVAAHRGDLSETEIELATGGQRVLQLTGAELSGQGRLYAHVGETAATRPFDVAAGNTVDLEHSMLIGDATSDGTFPVTLFAQHGGGTVQVPYFASSELTVHGEPGSDVTVRLESDAQPAREALLRYPMRLPPVSGLVLDAAQGIDGTAVAVTLANDGPNQTATSFAFSSAVSGGSASMVQVPVDQALDVATNLGVTVWFKPAKAGQAFVDYTLRNVKLSLNTSREVEAQIKTAGVTHIVKSAPVALGAWHQVSLAYKNGELSLIVDGHKTTRAAAGNLVKNNQQVPAITIGRTYDGLLSEFQVFDWSAESLLGFSDGAGAERTLTIGPNGTGSLTISSTGVQTTAAERVLKKWERRQRLLGDDGVRVAFAAELPQECLNPAQPEDPLDASIAFVRHLIHCELQVEARRLEVEIVDAGISRKAVVLLAERARVEVLTALAIKAQMYLEAVECSRAFGTGQSTQITGKVCSFASDLFFIGDLRDLVAQLFYFWTDNSEYDSSTHILAGVGLISELLGILAAETVVGGVAAETANVAAAGAKFIVKTYNKTGAFVRGMTDTLIKVIDWRNPSDSLRALAKIYPVIEIGAVVGLYHDEFGHLKVMLEEMVTDTDRFVAVANWFSGYYDWFNSLSKSEQDSLAAADGHEEEEDSDTRTRTAHAADLVIRKPVRKVLSLLYEVQQYLLTLQKVTTWPTAAIRRQAHERVGQAMEALLKESEKLPGALDEYLERIGVRDVFARNSIKALAFAKAVGGKVGVERLAGWRGMIGQANQIMNLEKLFGVMTELGEHLPDIATSPLRDGLRKVVSDLDFKPDADGGLWIAMAKAQGAAFHLHALRVAAVAGETITAIEKSVKIARRGGEKAYERIYDYVVRVGNFEVFVEVKSWLPRNVIQNLKDELKFTARKAKGSADDVADGIHEVQKKGPGQLFRDLLQLHGKPDAKVAYKLRNGSPSQDEIRKALREELDAEDVKEMFRAEIGSAIADDDAYKEWADDILDRLSFESLPDP